MDATPIHVGLTSNPRLINEINEMTIELRKRYEQLSIPPETLKQMSAMRRIQLMKDIEFLVESVQYDVINYITPTFVIPNNRNWLNVDFQNETVMLRPPQEMIMTEVKFNSKRFALMYELLDVVYKMLEQGTTCTKRELYYQILRKVSSQEVVNSGVLDVCSLLGCPPWSLGIFSSSKGLVAGPLIFTTADGAEHDCSKSSTGFLIPPDVHGLLTLHSTAKFVLVVEKDAVYQKLLTENILKKLGPCIVITGKGFPDVNTRLLLHQIWALLGIPIFALVDCDPFGIEIMCVYRYGSMTMAQEGEDLAVPVMRWLGVLPSYIVLNDISTQTLTYADEAKIKSLLDRPYVQLNSELLSEVEHMQDSNMKCEIEDVANLSSSYLTDVFIPSRIYARNYI